LALAEIFKHLRNYLAKAMLFIPTVNPAKAGVYSKTFATLCILKNSEP